MSEPGTSPVLDVRALKGTHETIAYKGGGLFPVLTVAPNATILAVLRGGAGHIGLAGRIEVVRSPDAGQTWTPPSVVADSDRDDRNPALGVSHQGTLVLSYHRQGSYDEQGNWAPRPHSDPDRPVEIMVTRSHDGGLSWEKPYPIQVEALRTGSPFGKIVALADGTLLLPIYHDGSYIVRSQDDGATWVEPSLIAAGMNETALLVLPDGGILALMRSEGNGQGLHSTLSHDGGHTWSQPVRVTAARKHPADLVMLRDGSILMTYGNRNPPYRIEGRISRDGGQSWLPALLAFSGHLYGYNVEAPRRTDLGYPSSVVVRENEAARGVTMYYYNPSLNQPAEWRDQRSEAGYQASGYYAIAVTWDEKELLARIEQLTR
jgi:hypothetical protein